VVFEAFVVRLVTRRFIGEYDQNKGQLRIIIIINNNNNIVTMS